MKTALALACLVCAAALVAGQFTPKQYTDNQAVNVKNNANGMNPCAGISPLGAWADVPTARVTTDPNFDDSVPADFGTIWTGQDNLNFYPNGFRKGQIYENNDPPFCFNVNSVKNKQVQVQIQTVNNAARLCIKDATTLGVRIMSSSIDRCFTDKTTACFGGLTYSDTLTLVIYSDSTAATTATSFWYRVRTSSNTWDLTDANARANSAIQGLEMWCQLMSQDVLSSRFPKELRSVVPPDNIKVTVTGAAASNAASLVTVMALAFAALFALLRQ